MWEKDSVESNMELLRNKISTLQQEVDRISFKMYMISEFIWEFAEIFEKLTRDLND